MSISLHGNLNQPLHDTYPDHFKEWILLDTEQRKILKKHVIRRLL